MSSDNTNAFALLMSGKKKRRKVVKDNNDNDDGASRFVQCPICQRSFSHISIDRHMEKCIVSPQLEASENNNNKDILLKEPVRPPSTSVNTPDGGSLNADVPQQDQQQSSVSIPSTTATTGNNSSNALQRLMQNSKQYYSEKVKRQQWFHLSSTGDVIWIRDDPDCCARVVDQLDIKWSTTVMIHASRRHEESSEQDIELHVTSSIEPTTKYQPLVAHKSRFSVPVLKSILQKGIRRRRPLPSVRVAMELADRSFGDLIRRLPIICLEDSFLHHEYPFLVWLMVAHSKDYTPNQDLVIRLFRVVFEIASCPWQDQCCVEPEEEQKKDLSLTVSSDLLHKDPECDLMLRSLMMRRKYGGMACDLRMIDKFVTLWSYRYSKQTVDDSKLVAAANVKRPEDDNEALLWKNLPRLLHPVEKSLSLVSPLVQNKLRYLQKRDISPAGVDFHCSNVLDVACTNARLLSDAKSLLDRPVSSQELVELLKHACWNCSAGMNFRRYWNADFPSADCSKKVDDKAKRLWEIANPIVAQFVNSYVDARLVKI